MARPHPPINGEVLHEARLGKGWTQLQVKELTRQAGCEIDDSNLSKYENGLIQRPTPKARKVLLEVFELTVEQLYAPCGACGSEWSAACLEHPASGQHDDTAPEATTEETRVRQPAA